MTQCCCGKIQFDDDHTPMVFNDMMHEVLGPKGNFCGPVITHTVRNLESEIDRLSNEQDFHNELLRFVHKLAMPGWWTGHTTKETMDRARAILAKI